MKQIIPFVLAICLSGALLHLNGQETVKDIDGNVYKIIQAGTQVWMTDNLKVTRFRNGELIPNVKEPGIWKDLTSPGLCDMNNNPDYSKQFGKLYNWYTAADDRNVCPEGWHVPSDREWAILTIYLTGEKGPLRLLPGMAEINQEIFSILPEGLRGYDGEYTGIGYGGGGWWSSTSATVENAYYRGVTYNTAGRVRMEGLKYFGYHIRCVKD